MGKRVLVFLVILALLVGFVSAENESALAESFDTAGGIMLTGVIPPAIPGAEAASKSNIGQPGNVFIGMKVANTGEQLYNVHVNYEIISGQEKGSSLQYVGEEGYLELSLEPGEYFIILKIDKLDTNGYDYYSKESFYVDGGINVTLDSLPIGSVLGTVSSKRGTLVSGATLDFECSKSYGDLSQQSTDEYGSFSSNYLPVGRCMVKATHNGLVGSESIDVQQGEITTVDLVLSSEVTGIFLMSWIVWLVIIVVVVAILVAVFVLRKRSSKPVVEEKGEDKVVASSASAEEEVKPEIPKRSLDILKTLNARERDIVKFLLDKRDPDPVLQNRIVHNTGIPKTSIVRIFENLQSKNIIELKKVGKAKKISLTAWFLEKE
ncbi:MAG: hypothetical protein ABIE94_03710 [archaeon]